MEHAYTPAVGGCLHDAVIDREVVARAVAQINRYRGAVGKDHGRFQIKIIDRDAVKPSAPAIPAHRFKPYAERCGTELTIWDQSDGTVAVFDPHAAMMAVHPIRMAIDEAEANHVNCAFCNRDVEPDDAEAGWLIIHVGRPDWAAYQARPICKACWHDHDGGVGCFEEAQHRYNPPSSRRRGYR
jgi:hypothetical protein